MQCSLHLPNRMGFPWLSTGCCRVSTFLSISVRSTASGGTTRYSSMRDLKTQREEYSLTRYTQTLVLYVARGRLSVSFQDGRRVILEPGSVRILFRQQPLPLTRARLQIAS